MARVCAFLTFPSALRFEIQCHSYSSFFTFRLNSLYSQIYSYRGKEPSVTGSVRAFESSSAKPMSWCDGVQEPRVLVAPDPGTDGNGLGQMILLRHPKSGNATQYLFVNGMLQELQWFKNLYGSWFLGDYITEDGRLYLSTPIDPVFIMLPIFEEARMKKGDDLGRFRQLDEILFVDGYPGYMQLMCIVENCMQVVSEIKEVGSSKFFRLDDSKVLRWLCYKEQSNEKKGTTAKKGRQEKKVKLETESHNIKDMFSRASRKKS